MMTFGQNNKTFPRWQQFCHDYWEDACIKKDMNTSFCADLIVLLI